MSVQVLVLTERTVNSIFKSCLWKNSFPMMHVDVLLIIQMNGFEDGLFSVLSAQTVCATVTKRTDDFMTLCTNMNDHEQLMFVYKSFS